MTGFTPQPPPRRSLRWLWVLLGLVLSLVMGAAAFVADRYYSLSKDQKALGEMVHRLQKPAFVLISEEQIYLDGAPVASTRGPAESDAPNWKVAALFRKRQARRYRHNLAVDDSFHREVELCAVEQTDFKVLKKVLYTCGLAGFTEQVVGLPEDDVPEDVSKMESSSCAMMELQPERPLVHGGAPERRLRINVQVSDDGHTITAGGLRMIVARKGESFDQATLALKLKGIHQRLPRKDDLTVVGEDGATTADMLATLETARKEFKYLSLVDATAQTATVAEAPDGLGGLLGGPGGLGLVGTGRGGGGTIGLGTLGTIGKGGGGSGAGYGRGTGRLKGRRTPAPRVIAGRGQVRGALDKEIIRRIIRRHLNEVKYCYAKELSAKPDLYGRLVIQFTIAGTGQVVMALVQSSTLKNRNVETCITRAVRRWLFPKPRGGGIVIVSYPFVLRASRVK